MIPPGDDRSFHGFFTYRGVTLFPLHRFIVYSRPCRPGEWMPSAMSDDGKVTALVWWHHRSFCPAHGFGVLLLLLLLELLFWGVINRKNPA